MKKNKADGVGVPSALENVNFKYLILGVKGKKSCSTPAY